MPHLTVLVGPPGAGKSTYAAICRAEVVSTDSYRESDRKQDYGHLLASSYKKINEHLAAGRDVVFDNPGANPTVRKAVLGIARKHGATATAAILRTPIEDCFKAQQSRKHPVPYEDVARLHRHIHDQIPTLAKEGFDAITIVDRRRK